MCVGSAIILLPRGGLNKGVEQPGRGSARALERDHLKHFWKGSRAGTPDLRDLQKASLKWKLPRFLNYLFE